MTPTNDFIPILPTSAPFTPEQRAYLNGFLAGLLSRAPAPPAPIAAAAVSAPPLLPVSILYGSQTGNAENLARRIAKEAGKRGFAATVHDLNKYPAAQLGSEGCLLVVTSTFGDGEPPDNAKAFWDLLRSDSAPRLEQTRFSICALGDSNYPKFCGFGKELDARFESLGAKRVHARADCDVDFDELFAKWLDASLSAFSNSNISEIAPPAPASSSSTGMPIALQGAATASAHSRFNPFPAELVVNRTLNGAGSAKDTRHFEIAVDGSRLPYEVGDALGVFPSNCLTLVSEMLATLGCSGEEQVTVDGEGEIPLRDALLTRFEITRISHTFLSAMAERSGDGELNRHVAPGVNGELTKFLWGREIIDLLLAFPKVKFTPREFVSLLKKLQPRLYSISSSPKAAPGRVHLTVNVVRYESFSRKRKGVCSTFLAERAAADAPLRVFVQSNKKFRLPPNAEAPVIMVGPGTGVAPFRAFLQERRALGAKGKNWLFFGDQHANTDFLYSEELEAMLRQGTLTRLDTAFSRDRAEKIYVQHRMREHAKELFAWLENGAHFYVCGDASRMAKDVDGMLHEVIQTTGGCTLDQAAE